MGRAAMVIGSMGEWTRNSLCVFVREEKHADERITKALSREESQ